MKFMPASGKSGMTSKLTLSAIENEARVRDVDLANELGMARPTNIRKFIETHRGELESFGSLHAVNAVIVAGKGARREATEYHLNRNQALLTCILSRTPKGREIRAEVIRRFNAYEQLVTTLQAVSDPRLRGGKPRVWCSTSSAES